MTDNQQLNEISAICADVFRGEPFDEQATIVDCVRELATRSRSQWTRTKDRLPQENLYVNVVIGGIVQYSPARLFGNRWHWYAEADSAPNSVVTHWQPLPAAPKEKSRGK